MERLFDNNYSVFQEPDATILLVSEATEVEMSLTTEDNFFFSVSDHIHGFEASNLQRYDVVDDRPA